MIMPITGAFAKPATTAAIPSECRAQPNKKREKKGKEGKRRCLGNPLQRGWDEGGPAVLRRGLGVGPAPQQRASHVDPTARE